VSSQQNAQNGPSKNILKGSRVFFTPRKHTLSSLRDITIAFLFSVFLRPLLLFGDEDIVTGGGKATNIEVYSCYTAPKTR
jgi:hypothetical protein